MWGAWLMPSAFIMWIEAAIYRIVDKLDQIWHIFKEYIKIYVVFPNRSIS